jgi:hypothetical protein
MTYKTKITIWSAIGSTPITNRGGSYCDELASVTVYCESPGDALAKTLEIKNKTKHAYACHYTMPDYPNQNTRSGFCHYG